MAAATRPPLLAVALISASALAYEVLLLRLFSIIQWHHFATMVISLALLGYGASGTLLSLGRGWLLARFRTAFPAALLLFPVTALGGFLLAQRLPLAPEALLWEGGQAGVLLVLYLLLAVPFCAAGGAVGLALIHHAARVGRVYAADLIGAGSGSLAVLVLLWLLPPGDALLAISSLGLVAAALALHRLGHGRARAVLALAAAAVPWLLPAAWTELHLSPYKELAQTLRIKGAERIAERSGPLGELVVVRNREVPLRVAPGLSLRAATAPPEQLALFADGDGVGAITRLDGGRDTFAYLDQMTAALPYHMLRPQRVLVLNAGAGEALLRAYFHRADAITAIELNPRLPVLLAEDLGAFPGDPYRLPGVRLVEGAVRELLKREPGRYDLIALALPNAPGAAAAGLHDIKQGYDYTIEALALYLTRLEPHGLLALTGWTQLPARDLLKLLASAAAALRAFDPGAQPLRQVAMVRGWQTATLLVKPRSFTPAEIDALRTFAASRGFDVAYYPGMAEGEANRFNRLPQPIYYRAALALLGTDPQPFLHDYRYDLTPARDDRPYFFDFFSWRLLTEAVAGRERGGLALLTTGFPLLLLTLTQALVAALVLIVAPLALLRRPRQEPAQLPREQHPTGTALAYFALLGLGFLLIEVAFIHQFVLFLHHPLHATAVALAGFLVFAGLGSRFVQRRTEAGCRVALGRRALLFILGFGITSLFWLPGLFDALIGAPAPVRYAVALVIVAPLAGALGMPFPLGLIELERRAPRLLPWAWGVNGCSSVVAALLGSVVAIAWGFTAVLALGLVCYAGALIAHLGLVRHAPRAAPAI